jgi:hypothetical protein
MNLFISSLHFDKPILTICKNVLPFIAILALALLLITYIPSLSTLLPDLIDGERLTPASSGSAADGENLLFDALGGDDDELDALLKEVESEMEEEALRGD